MSQGTILCLLMIFMIFKKTDSISQNDLLVIKSSILGILMTNSAKNLHGIIPVVVYSILTLIVFIPLAINVFGSSKRAIIRFLLLVMCCYVAYNTIYHTTSAFHEEVLGTYKEVVFALLTFAYKVGLILIAISTARLVKKYNRTG